MSKNRDNVILGVDVGASGIKGGLVDIASGEMLTERKRLETPNPATPGAMAEVFGQLVKLHDWKGPVGVGFPAIIRDGIARSAANIDKSWINTNVRKLLSQVSGCEVEVLNDADAAGVAEMAFGKGKDTDGVVILITIGSGLGSALFTDGKLVPNTEFGHVLLHDMIAEHYAASSVRKKFNLSWEVWGKRLNEYLNYIDRILSPKLIILGGGVSRRFEDFAPYLEVGTEVTPAELRNNAGTIGAAVCAAERRIAQAH